MKYFTIILLCYIISAQQANGEMMVNREGEFLVPPKSNDVVIAPNAIIMPLGRILLVRKSSKYCAIKFIKFWTGQTDEDMYAEYESYYKSDNLINWSNEDVEFRKGTLSAPKPRGLGRFAFSFGNRNINCGFTKLQWSGKGSVYFYKEGWKQDDYGIEIAPTIWTDILQVNIHDERIKWYRFDNNRKRVTKPVDKIWETKENGGTKGNRNNG
ncbi:hypothetical protein ACFL0H_03460 [Thermodesulfobacteriota bacterium]